MNLEKRKEVLVEEFKQNSQKMNSFQQQMNLLQTRQIQIQGQLQLIEALEQEKKEEKEKSKKE